MKFYVDAYKAKYIKLTVYNFLNVNFWNSRIQYDFEVSFQSYRNLIQVVAVGRYIPIDSPWLGLSTGIVIIVQAVWPFFTQAIYYGQLPKEGDDNKPILPISNLSKSYISFDAEFYAESFGSNFKSIWVCVG
jgi:hypothetical protein